MMGGRGKVPPPVPRKRPKVESGGDSKTRQSHEYSPSDSVYHVPKEVLVSCEDLLRLPFLYDDVGEGFILAEFFFTSFFNLFFTGFLAVPSLYFSFHINLA